MVKRFRDIVIGCIVISLFMTMVPITSLASGISGEQEISEENDDPGNARLAGNVPAEFYDDGKVFSARASYMHNSRFDGYEIQKGIDVSHHQGTIDWNKVKAAGIQFAIIRVGYRGYGSAGNLAPDKTAATNIKNATQAGIPVGVYIYSQAITEAEAIEEAKYVLNAIKGYTIELPVVMDYEYYGSNSGRLYNAKLSRRKATDNCLAFCEVVEEAGYNAMVYANKSFLRDQLYADELSSQCEIWLANYTTATDYEGEYSYWQYTSTGRVNGISGNVDMNFHYIEPKQDGEDENIDETLNVTEIRAKKIDSSSIDLKWGMVSDASGYEVQRYNTITKNFETIETINDGTIVSYIDAGMKSGFEYKYRVRAYKSVDEDKVYGAYSRTVVGSTKTFFKGKAFARENVRLKNKK